jgi:hypothetical protein
MRRLIALALAAGAGPIACASELDVRVAIVLPAETARRGAESARIIAVDLPSRDDWGSCPTLLRGLVVDDRTPALAGDTGQIPLATASSGVTFALDPGVFAFVAVAHDADGEPVLSGCTVAEVFDGAPATPITMR